jgi:RNA polymerase sigma factor (sigma-70 family)
MSSDADRPGDQSAGVPVSAHDWLTEAFEPHRDRLRAIAYRMLGSTAEAEDAVQETWLRLNGTDIAVHNLGGWLTTVIGRICLDMLRSRAARREQLLREPVEPAEFAIDPEQEALLADSVGAALIVVLDTLTPAERLAFVLHDLFAVPFTEIAPVLGRSTAAAKMLASRARRRVRAADPPAGTDPSRRTALVRAFLAASRNGDFEALLGFLDPDVDVVADDAAIKAGAPAELHGAAAVARQFTGKPRTAVPALVDGAAGATMGRGGKPLLVFDLTFAGNRIAHIDVIGDPEHLRLLDLQVLPPDGPAPKPGA